MKKYYTVVLCILCSGLSHAGTEYTLTMNFENTERDFIVHLPTSYTSVTSLPVVFNLHGYGSNAAQQIFYSRMDLTADANNFICVFPNGLNSSWNSGFAPPYNSSPNDVGFISKIIDTLYQLYNINLSRVYSCGMSNGGYQSYRLACDLENRIAAIASVTGSLTSLTAINCALSRSVPVLEIHGTADPLVDYNGGAGYYGTEQTIDFWTDKNSCLSTPDTTAVPDTNPNDSSTVQKIKYLDCNNGTEVWLYKITGGGHTWPSAPIDYIYGPTNRDINASQEIWDFFNRFTLNGSVGIEENYTAPNFRCFPSPFQNELTIQFDSEFSTQTARLYDLVGNVITEVPINHSTEKLYLGVIPSGIYLLKSGNTVRKLFKE